MAFPNLVPTPFPSLAPPTVKRRWCSLVTCLLRIICTKGVWVGNFQSIGDRTHVMIMSRFRYQQNIYTNINIKTKHI